MTTNIEKHNRHQMRINWLFAGISILIILWVLSYSLRENPITISEVNPHTYPIQVLQGRDLVFDRQICAKTDDVIIYVSGSIDSITDPSKSDGVGARPYVPTQTGCYTRSYTLPLKQYNLPKGEYVYRPKMLIELNSLKIISKPLPPIPFTII